MAHARSTHWTVYMGQKRQSFISTIRDGSAAEQMAALRDKLIEEANSSYGRDLAAVCKELMMVDGVLPQDADRSSADYRLMRDRLAGQIDSADDDVLPGRDVAALARTLREVIVRLDLIPQAGERSNVVDITERVQASWTAPAHRDSPGSGRNARTGSDRTGRGRRAGS